LQTLVKQQQQFWDTDKAGGNRLGTGLVAALYSLQLQLGFIDTYTVYESAKIRRITCSSTSRETPYLTPQTYIAMTQRRSA
jgi:hypothetical protein